MAPKASRQILEPLIERRKQQGFRALVVDSSDDATNGELILARLKAAIASVPGKTRVLLAGAPPLVGSLRGSVGRMKGEESDAGFGLPGSDSAPTVAVGRFPARTEAELRAMVEKTLRFEDDQPPAGWRSGLFLMVGDPGGGMLPDLYVQGTVDADLAQVDPSWTVRALFNVPTSRFFYPPPLAVNAASNMFAQGALFSVYLGHSNAGGMDFLGRNAFATMSIAHGNGPFFTCGCYALQSSPDEDGYGLEAMRNPRGPAAVIGATGESYSAPGQLAAQGLMMCFSKTAAPERLGDYWLAAAEGLARGKMDSATYALLDAADGSGGQETMEAARREHLEMWMLLGDPAMRLPVVPRDIRFDVTGTPAAGQAITISGALPERLKGGTVVVALQRPLSSSPTGIEKVSDPTTEQIAANNERANDYSIASAQTAAQGDRFSATLTLPTDLPWSQVIVRVSAWVSNDCARGVKLLNVAQK